MAEPGSGLDKDKFIMLLDEVLRRDEVIILFEKYGGSKGHITAKELIPFHRTIQMARIYY